MTGIEIGWGTTLAIKTVIVLGIVPLTALILGYVFLLKMMSHMQSRLGPMDPGGFHGWYQLIGDGIKFLQKEDIMPEQADRRVFALAPAIVVLSTFLVFVVIPAGPRIAVAFARHQAGRTTAWACSTRWRSRRCRSSVC